MTEISHVFTHQGPFSTVYLDATRATESGAHEIELRWRALRGSLTDQGAGEADLAALDDALENARDAGSTGLVLVAAGGSVVFRGTLPRPPLRESASVAALPFLMPYFAQRGSRTPYLAVTVDRQGAEIVPAPWLAEQSVEVTGSQGPVHKTGRNTWDELHFQHRVENAWEANARDVADAIVKIAAAHAIQLVIVTGDPRARALLTEQLQSGLREGTDVVTAEAGGREPGPGSAEHAEAVHDAVLRHDWRSRRELLEHLQQNLGRERYAVAGVREVVDAVRSAAVDTLVVSDDPSSTLRAFIGPDPTHLGLTEQELHDMGVAEPLQDRLDSALIRAVYGTGARLVVTPNAHDYLPEGIGALLRFDGRA
jgi:hypothetical protein